METLKLKKLEQTFVLPSMTVLPRLPLLYNELIKKTKTVQYLDKVELSSLIF